MTAHGGRPHWGKVHTRDAAYFAGVYPRFGEFTALRDRLDPDRLFGNDYLRRVLGDELTGRTGASRPTRDLPPCDLPCQPHRRSGHSEWMFRLGRFCESGHLVTHVPDAQLPPPERSSAARRSTPVARMEYCGEPWARPPSRVSGPHGRGPKAALDPAAPRHRTGTRCAE